MSDHDDGEQAPRGLLLLQELVNSLDYPSGPDELGSPERATAWLRRHGVRVTSALGDADRERLIELREALRDLLETHTGKAAAPGARTSVNRALAAVPLTVELREDGGVLAPASSGVDGLVARLSAAVVEATITGTWSRLKVCAADTCRFAFYDRSKNGSRAWCSMQVCGSRAKARSYRERRRTTA
ncbi:MAG: CGNR zinc finger domain-containing protein [Candidatus Dormibacteraeota bacterium]|nr:CGNR zinc finger domain-containing protein [Candidatus Dormibacteraeota bacterium]